MADFYEQAARARLDRIDAEKQQSLADLAQAKSNADYESAAYSVQQIANLEAEKANLLNLHHQYVQSQQPVYRPEPSREERAARDWSQMTYDDALELARGSKYAKDLDHSDANVQAGYRQVAARRQRGE